MTLRGVSLAVALMMGANAANQTSPLFPPAKPCPLEMQTILMNTADTMYQKYHFPIAMGYSGPDGKGGECSMGYVLNPTATLNETVSAANVAQCDSEPQQKTDCGYMGIDEGTCLSRGCCWKEVPGQPYCYRSGEPPSGPPNDRCSVDDSARRDCGWMGVNQNTCQQKGCCWKPTNPGSPWCFYGSGSGPVPGPTPAPGHGIPPQSPKDDFLYGSFTKVWTASAILKAHKEGKLNIDEPAWKYLEPAFRKATNGDSLWNYYADSNEHIKSVTIRQMLIMRGNFRDFDEIKWQEQNPTSDLSPSDIVRQGYGGMDNTYSLDSCGSYSSLSYTLLGLVLNGLADQSWDQYDQNVWRDLFPKIRFGVHGTCSTYTEVPGDCSECYPHSALDMSCTAGYSCGNLIGPPEEVARFAHALFSGALLGEEITSMMLRGQSIRADGSNSAGPQQLGPQGATDGNPCRGFDEGQLYGMGVEMHNDPRKPGHEGVTYGFTTQTYYDLDRKASYVAGIATSSFGMDGKAWDCWYNLHNALNMENPSVIVV